jgi:alcohol dehydrogenase (cytochrome c)
MTTHPKAVLASAIALVLTSGSHAVAQDATIPDADWRLINRDLSATRYSPLDQITTANVDQLELSWSYRLSIPSTAVPIVVDGVMYLPNGGQVIALDADTGREVWATSLAPVETDPDRAQNPRGGRFGGGRRRCARTSNPVHGR